MFNINKDSLEKEDFLQRVNSKEYITIDIRTLEEVNIYGDIEWTDMRMDFYLPWFTQDILKLDKSKKYLIYCWHGNRTHYLKEFMKQNWFVEVYDLKWWIDVL